MISHVMTLANGIIGVSVLAMPFCFKQCGIILATLVLLLSSMLSRLACHFLVKSAVMSRRRNFEFLAFHAFGPMGKFLVELCIIGFLLGTCIAFFVVVGDLGPQIIGEMIKKSPEGIRTSFLITTGIFVVLPLGLLRNIDSLASVSTASIAFYICLVLKVIAESTHHIFAADWLDKVHYWRPGGILQCLPIFALALFCQTQLFEIYEAIPNATLEKMNQVVRGALNICTAVYICVGFFGYIAFCTQPFTGNILMSFEPSLTSEIIKIGFVLSVAFSFPLVIFPCRASLNSLLFKRGYAHETSTSYISEARFRCLTTFIVTIALIVGVLIPNIEFVLGIVGSTIGVIICLIFPATFFISISTKNTNERLLAQIMVIIGIWIMVLGTYANLYALEQSSNLQAKATTIKLPSQMNNIPHVLINDEMLIRPDEPKQLDNLLNIKDEAERPKLKVPDKHDNENARQEPPVPVEILPENDKIKDKLKTIVLETMTINPKMQVIVNNEQIKEVKDSLEKNKETNELPIKNKIDLEPAKENEKFDSVPKNDVIAVEAIKKEEQELAADKEMSNVDTVQRREELEKTLQKHIMEEKNLMKEQKELLKDIEQTKKEIQLDAQVDQNKNKNDNADISEINDKFQQEKKSDLNKEKSIELKQESIKTDLKVDIDSIKKDVKLLNIDNSQNNDGIKNNEIPVEKKHIESKQLIGNENAKNIIELPSNSKLDQAPADLPIKKSEDPIIKALTKQSNKISNGNDIPKNLNDINLEDKKINDKRDEKNEEYSIPIVLKMNNQTKVNSDLERSQVNLSNINIAPAKRDILEDHQREKRMVEEEVITVKAVINETDKDNSLVDKALIVEKETCIKKVKNEIQSDELIDTKNAEDLIKTSAHLSEQDIVNKVSIEPDLTDLTAVSGFVKLKKRDLKALKFENDNEK